MTTWLRPAVLWRLPFKIMARETPEYLVKKFEDHRSFMAAMCTMGAIFGPALWMWDHVTDPVGAVHTGRLRLIYLLFVGLTWLLHKRVSPRRIAAAAVALLLASEAIFLHILSLLDQGMLYGQGGFLVFIYSPLLLFRGFSLRFNLVYLVLASAFPQLLVLLLGVSDFQQSHYAVLIWPTAVMMAMAQFANAHSEWRRHVSELALMAASNTDPLTGVANRRAFRRMLHAEMARARQFQGTVSLLMLDIDRFKAVNDRHGHPSGDLVICQVARCCSDASRDVDTVARMGGEEFAVLLAGADMAEAQVVAERVRRAIEASAVRSLAGLDIRVTVSIGVGELGGGEFDDDDLIVCADEALLQAKADGRNCVRAWHGVASTA